MISQIKKSIKKITYRHSKFKAERSDSIKLFWWNEKENVGDALNFNIANWLSGDKVIEWVPHNYKGNFITSVGSVAQLANEYTTIWGSGLISKDAVPFKKPKHVLAVRGPLTRDRLNSLGIDCPRIYGDPALLLPNLITGGTERKKYKLGIIPHFVDKENPFFKQDLPDWIKVIDVETVDVKKFINEILECEKIVSSSLHGIILSDAYNVPSSRISFSSLVTGGDFKFADYSFSVGRNNFTAQKVDVDFPIVKLLGLNFELGKFECGDDLLEVNPFEK
ncbi:polysaccharide pyruvyl transferase family protein [Photobacterium sagamiensis]|uniref:polysaccharide pyruvyl transferase family protein n=1 Tax=Photobacterium sagamiensis TaxID=2910241 RepID=UPI003D0C4517